MCLGVNLDFFPTAGIVFLGAMLADQGSSSHTAARPANRKHTHEDVYFKSSYKKHEVMQRT